MTQVSEAPNKGRLSKAERQKPVAGKDLLAAALAGKPAGEIAAILAVRDAQAAAVAGMSPDPLKQAMKLTRLPVRSLFGCQARTPLSTKATQVREDVLRVVHHYELKRRLYDETGAVHRGLLRNLRQVGFFGFTIPVEYGGAGASHMDSLDLTVEIGKMCPALPPYFSVTAVIGIVGALIQCGTPAQKNKWLPLIARGKAFSCFAATENGKGCDITNAEARGVIEVENDVVKITATKLFISLAQYTADEVAFEADDFVDGIAYGEAALSGKSEGEVTCFTAEFFKLRTGQFNVLGEEILNDVLAIIELPRADSEHFALNKSYRLKALHPKVPNCGIWMRDFAVPVDNLLAGDGLTTIFRDLNAGRFWVGLGAGMLQRHLLSAAMTFVTTRKGLKDSHLDSFQKVRFTVAKMAARIAGGDALSMLAASLEDHHVANEVMAMIAKVEATNWAREGVTISAVEQHGGRALIDEHIVPQLLWEVIVACIYEGPNSVLDMASLERLISVIQESGLSALFGGLAQSGVDLFALWPRVDKSVPAALSLLETRSSLLSAKTTNRIQKRAKKFALKSLMVPVLWGRQSRRLFQAAMSIAPHSRELLKNRQTLMPAAKELYRFWRTINRPIQIDLEGQSLHQMFAVDSTGIADSGVAERFCSHLELAAASFGKWRLNLFNLLLKYMKAMASEQLVMHFDGYEPVAKVAAILSAVCAASDAAKRGDVAMVDALDLQCELLRCDLLHVDPTSTSLKAAVDRVYDHVKAGRFKPLHGTTVYAMLQPTVERETFDAMMDAVAKGEPFAYPVNQAPIPFAEYLAARDGRLGYGHLAQ